MADYCSDFQNMSSGIRAPSWTVAVNLESFHEFRFSAQVIFAAWTVRAKLGGAKIELIPPSSGKSLDFKAVASLATMRASRPTATWP